MSYLRLSYTVKVIVLLVLVLNLVKFSFAQFRNRAGMGRPFPPFRDNRFNKGIKFITKRLIVVL